MSSSALAYDNTGNGHFALVEELLDFDGSLAPTAVDLNADGHDDLITHGLTPEGMRIELGGPSPSLAPAHWGSGVESLRFVMAGDVNLDGHTDLVTCGEERVATLFGYGDGTFIAERAYTTPTATDLASGDLDGDGDPDLIVSSAAHDVVPAATHIEKSP